MAEPDKAAERTDLVLHLGRLLASIYDLIQQVPPPSSSDYQVAAARFRPDCVIWREEAARFVIVGGVTFGHELDDIAREPWNLFSTLAGLARDAQTPPAAKQAYLRDELKKCEQRTIAAIDLVPITLAPLLLAQQTPFSTFLRIRDAVLTARFRLHYFDRYIDADFFPLYIRGLDRSVQIRLVTTPGDSNYGVQNVLAVSKLTAQEFSDFALLECTPGDMHDRNLRIDDKIFFLGPSLSAAGKYPTNFSPADSTPNAHLILDSILSKAKVVT